MFENREEAHEWLDKERGASWTDKSFSSSLKKKLNEYEYEFGYGQNSRVVTHKLWCESADVFLKVMEACTIIGHGIYKPLHMTPQEDNGQLLMF